MRTITAEELAKLGIHLDSVDQPLGTLSGGERQCVAIARAVYFGAKVLILDEPTAALGVKQSGIVLKYVDLARESGVAVVFITHNPHHAFLIGDHFAVLSLGRMSLNATRTEITLDQLIAEMAGRQRAHGPRPRALARDPGLTTSIAAVVEEPGRIALRRLPVPDPEPGAVVLAVHLSGICGTDKHTFRGESKQYAGTPHERDLEYPLICGHENVGTVAAIGGRVFASDGTELRVGDRLVPGANVSCGRCHFCANGFPYYFCERLEDYGNSLNLSRAPGLFGGWSEYLYLLPGTPLFRVPDALPDEVAVITEVMAVTHGVDTALVLQAIQGGSRAGFSVAVLGTGPLGLCHLVKSRMLGAGMVVATDVLPERLERAAAFGVDLGLVAGSTSVDDRVSAIMDATHGRGVDIALDCSGVPETFTEALQVVRMGGVVVEAGAFVDMGPVQMNPNSDICSRNVAVLGIGGERATEYEPSMQLMVANLDRYPLRDIVSHILPLDQAQEAVLLAQSGSAMQVALDPRLPLGNRTAVPTTDSSAG